MNKNDSIFALLLVLSLIGGNCTTTKKAGGSGSIPFSDVNMRLIYGKTTDSSSSFLNDQNEYFLIRFDKNKFKNFDGSFQIRGTSRVPGSVYYTSTPYVGFYKARDKEQIYLQWFKNISWSMDFHKHEMGKLIGRLFNFEGMYEYDGNTLVFFKQELGSIGRDTIIVMRPVTSR